MTAAVIDPTRPSPIHWEPRRSLTLQGARRRALIMRAWRWFCIGVCVAAALAVIGSAMLRTLDGFALGNSPPTADSVKIVNPRFTGRSTDGTVSYVITAKSA